VEDGRVLSQPELISFALGFPISKAALRSDRSSAVR